MPAVVEYDPDREAAIRASKNCPHGCSEGLVIVYRSDRQPFVCRTKRGREYHAKHVVMVCTCPMGRRLIDGYAGRPPFPDLEAHRKSVFTHGEMMTFEASAAGLPVDGEVERAEANAEKRRLVNQMFTRADGKTPEPQAAEF